MSSHFVPIIKHEGQLLFLLNQSVKSKTWTTFEDIRNPDETELECAIRCGRSSTFGVIYSANKEPYYTQKKGKDFYCFMESDVCTQFANYLNRMLVYALEKKRNIHKDDILKVRWFSIDEIISFKDVSQDLVSVLLAELHKFHSGPRLPAQPSLQEFSLSN